MLVFGSIAVPRFETECFERIRPRVGVDTCRFVDQGELEVDSSNRIYAGRYEPTPAVAFIDMMRTLDIRHDKYTFVNIGSGKGHCS